MARPLALAAALAVALLAVTGAGGAGAQTPKRGGTVVIGGAPLREPACLNAYLQRCFITGNPMGLALRGPFSIGADNAYRPDLVSHVDYTITPPYTLTYHLRPEARWSDGVPISARDFEFTHAALRSVRGEILEEDARIYSRMRVTAVDAKTVRVVLRSRFASWRGLFPYILPSHALRGEDFSKVWLSGISNPKTGRPIGSGPFLVESWARGRAVTFVRNPRYWKSHSAYLERLVLRFCSSCAALADEQVGWMRVGEVDVLHSPVLSGAQVQELRALPGVSALVGRGVNWEHLDIRGWGEGGDPLLNRKRVRQALAYGIDRVALARALHVQIDPRYPPSDSALFLTYSARYQPNWRRYRRNQAEARRLLEREGCRRGTDGIYACDGRRLSLRLVTLAANARREQTLKLIQGQLRQVGIEIVPVYAPAIVLFNQILPNGDFDLALFSWITFPDSPGASVGLYGCQGDQNFSGYCQRLVTRDLDQAQRILEPARQAELLNGVDAQLVRDVPVIPLFENPQVVAHRTTVRGVRRTAQVDPFVGVEDWWLER